MTRPDKAAEKYCLLKKPFRIITLVGLTKPAAFFSGRGRAHVKKKKTHLEEISVYRDLRTALIVCLPRVQTAQVPHHRSFTNSDQNTFAMCITMNTARTILASLAALLVVHDVQASPFPAAIAAPRALGVRDEAPGMPFDPDTISTCSWWWDNDGSIACSDMPAEWGMSLKNFLLWVSQRPLQSP